MIRQRNRVCLIDDVPVRGRPPARRLRAMRRERPALAVPAIGPDGGNGAAPEPAPAPAPVIVRTVDEGFDVGSAAIGAGGAGALLVLISLGGFAYAGHRHPRAPVMR
jgi:hypothetical protein